MKNTFFIQKGNITALAILIIGVFAVVVWLYFKSRREKFSSNSLDEQSDILQSFTPILKMSFSQRYNQYLHERSSMPLRYFSFKSSNVSLSQIKDFMTAAQFSLLAYNTDTDAITNGCKSMGATLIGAVNNSASYGGCWAFVARYKDTQVLAIQGTEFVPGDYDIAEVWADLSVTPRFLKKRSGIPAAMYVHSGFYNDLLDLWPKILNLLDYNLPVWICGHSLGGVRTMIARYLIPQYVHVRITNFGAPQGANSQFWDYVMSSNTVCERVLADNDFAGDWQPVLPYYHPSPSFYWLTQGKINLVTQRDELNVSFSDHSILDSYIPKLQHAINSY